MNNASRAQSREVLTTIRYLISSHPPEKTRELFGERLNNFTNEYEEGKVQHLATSYGIPYVQQWDRSDSSDSHFWIGDLENQEAPIEGYRVGLLRVNLSNQHVENKVGRYFLEVNGCILSVKESGEKADELDLCPALRALSHAAESSKQRDPEQRRINLNVAGRSYLIIINNVGGSYNDDAKKVVLRLRNLNLDLFIR